jgi:heat-inducible transcriptional repressor
VTEVLDERKAAILKAVVEEYIETAVPVGSAAVTRNAQIGVSSATVRNELSVLEADGYLAQPHTSAGRIPTEKGYRHFVDTVGQARLARPEQRQVLDFFNDVRGEIEGMMRDTAGLLSSLTHHAAVVIDHSSDAARVRSFQLVSLAPRLVLAVVVFSNGVVEKHTLELDDRLVSLDDELDAVDRAASVVRASLDDRALADAREPDRSGDTGVDRLVSSVLSAIGASAFDERVYVDGASRVANSFEAVDSVKRVLTILEQQLVVVDLITDVLNRGLKVAIGTETGDERLEECSVVVSPYEIDGENAGSIAILGPTRMNYPQAIAAVSVVGRQLGVRLSEG